jgi:carbonic anhydrase
MTPYEQLFENNRRWVASKRACDDGYFTRLAESQQPAYFYIGCADSRVPANEIMGLEPGEVFVHRNVANLVNNTDLNAMSCIEYAVRTLRVRHIIVCGHYNCGGVLAAMQPRDMGLLNPWLRNIRDVYRLHADELDRIDDTEIRYRRLVELNVVEQARNVIKSAAVQQSFLAHGFPRVHGWVCELSTGLVRDLDIDFERVLVEIKKIYNLTGQPD